MNNGNQNDNYNVADVVLKIISGLSRTAIVIIVAVLAVIVAIVGLIYLLNRGNNISIFTNRDIGITPTQIQSIENIGEWEFLSISDEELIDTIRYGFFGDDELVRIYYGTLRLGIQLSDAKEGWISNKGDSIEVVLPPVKLLDEDFIDEARTKSFFESGKWTAKDREDLYQRAKKAMMERCLTTENMNSAEQNASQQFYKILKSMGFDNVVVRNTR